MEPKSLGFLWSRGRTDSRGQFLEAGREQASLVEVVVLVGVVMMGVGAG